MKARAEWRLGTRHIGRRVLVYDQLDSTNTAAAALADDAANDGVAILADVQSAGRGHQGRSWQCPPGAGVLLSVLLFPPPAWRRPVVLTALAAVSVCEVVSELTGRPVGVKWPNDILLGGRKVCGILIEQSSATIVGIGLNVNQSDQQLIEAGLPGAVSLAAVTGRPLDRDEVARRLLVRLDRHYGRLLDGEAVVLEGLWQLCVGLLGQPVIAECGSETRRGRLTELSFDRLKLESASDGRVEMVPESVRHLTPG